MLNKLFYITLLLFLASSCRKDDTQFSINGGNVINTYSSPSAYYGKPFSRMYINPYDIYHQRDPDNDRYYVAPKSYGSTP